jgi:hypothetical protein
MHRVAAKCLPRLLTDEQKANRATVSQELFDRSNADENFQKTIKRGCTGTISKHKRNRRRDQKQHVRVDQM